jgi:hypothetical protein
MARQANMPQHPLHKATTLKVRLVSWGLYALSHGEWQMVVAITLLIKKGGMRHA